MYKTTVFYNDYYCAKIQEVASMDQRIYNPLARTLMEKIGESDFFNGVVELETEELSVQLILTLIIHRNKQSNPNESAMRKTEITRITPVWWEFRTFDSSGQTDNDLSWQEFIEYLI